MHFFAWTAFEFCWVNLSLSLHFLNIGIYFFANLVSDMFRYGCLSKQNSCSIHVPHSFFLEYTFIKQHIEIWYICIYIIFIYIWYFLLFIFVFIGRFSSFRKKKPTIFTKPAWGASHCFLHLGGERSAQLRRDVLLAVSSAEVTPTEKTSV